MNLTSYRKASVLFQIRKPLGIRGDEKSVQLVTMFFTGKTAIKNHNLLAEDRRNVTLVCDPWCITAGSKSYITVLHSDAMSFVTFVYTVICIWFYPGGGGQEELHVGGQG